MNKTTLKTFLSLFVILMISIGSPQKMFAKTVGDTINIASEPDYPPYCFVDENGHAAGFSVDLFRAAAHAAGLTVNIKIGTWNTIKQYLAEGKIDALPLVGRTPEREAFYDFTMPYLSLHGAVFVKKGTKDIQSIADLKNKSIVVMKGDNAEEFVRRENISSHIVTTPTFEDAFIALANGYHDAVITQRVMGIELLKKSGIKNVVPLDFHLPQYRQDFCFAVQKGDTQLLSRLNEGLSIIIANDTYENIRNKWFGPSIKEKISIKELLSKLFFSLIPIVILIALTAIFLLRKEVNRRTLDLQNEIADHKKTMHTLSITKEKYHGMIMNLMEGFYSATLDGILLDYNPEFTRILKLDPNKNHSGIMLPDFWVDPNDRKTYLNAIQKNGYIRNYEARVNTATGENITVLVSSRLVKNANDNSYRIEGSFLDISERIQAYEELRQLKTKLEDTVTERTTQLQEKIEKLNQSHKAMLFMVEDLNNLTAELEDERQKLLMTNQELESFTYSVSHDLRAPLRAIDGFGKFLLEDYGDKLDDEGKRFIQVIRENTGKMDKLINDLLNLSRISRAEMNIMEVDMYEIANSMFHETASEAEKKDFYIHVDKLPPAYCDITLIKQVWLNLIDNALKYSSKSKLKKIEISATENKKENIYSVKDFGAGFDGKYVDKIFGVFQRLHNEKEFPGTGVGLAIVKNIIQRHGGNVWAEGKLNKGSTFCFSLPRIPPNN